MKNKTRFFQVKTGFSVKGSLVLLTIIFTSIMFSCSKENIIENEMLQEEEATNPVISQLKAMGFEREDIEELENYYLVEGDILFPKDIEFYHRKKAETRQTRTNNLVSITNVNSMSVFVEGTIPTNGVDNWRDAITAAMNDLNGIDCSAVRFISTNNSSTADIIVKSDGNNLGGSTIAAAGFPNNDQPYNEILINLDYSNNVTVTESQKRRNMVHEFGHCIGLRHTNWKGRGEKRKRRSIGAHHIAGTPSTDDASVMNGGTANDSWSGFSPGDIVAIETLYPQWKYSSGGVNSWACLATSGIPLEDLRFGDFNGDGRTDVFGKFGNQWRYSPSGSGSWVNLTGSSVSLGNLRFGDFNGDGKTDVFTKIGDQWKYSSGGVLAWTNLTGSSVPYYNLRFGDFDGDGKTDVFTKIGNQWKYSSGGVLAWANLASSGVSLNDLRFGDFNGDGKTDVFTKIGNQWKYSSGGAFSWVNLASSGVPLNDLRFGDFNGDGKTDVFAKIGEQWKYSSGGASSWINLTVSGVALENLRFGDFNGDGRTDIFTKLEL